MAFTNYGTGNWKTPEFGLTEKFGGKTKSMDNAMSNTVNSAIQSTKSWLPAQSSSYDWGKVLGTSSIQPVQKSSSGGSSSKSSSQGGGSSKDNTEEQLRKQQQQELDSLYGNIFNQIGAMKSNLQASKPNLLSIAAAPYDAVVPKVNQALQEGQQTYETAKTDASRQGENALTAARNLYNELSARNRQLFGGVTNVGQAAGELLGRQQMQTMGDTRQNTSNQLQDYTVKAQQLKEKADAQLQQLEMQKQSAVQQAELEFRDKLSELDNLEVKTRTSKSTAKMNLLQNYLQRVYQINDEARSFERTLRASAAGVDLSSYTNVANDWLNGAQNDYSTGMDSLGNQLDQSQQGLQEGTSLSSPDAGVQGYLPQGIAPKAKKTEDYAYNPLQDAAQLAMG